MAVDWEFHKDCVACIRGLLAELAQTHHAAEAFHVNERHIADLKDALAQMPKRIESLDKLREASLRRHKMYRDSVMKRFAFRLLGHASTFNRSADRNRQCYYDVLRQEHKVKEEERRLGEQHASAVLLVEDLKPVALRHRKIQYQLDNLYEGLFQCALERDKEHANLKSDVERARHACREAQAATERARLAVSLLTAATDNMQIALGEVGQALKQGTMDGGYSTEKKLLRQAQANVCTAQRRFGQARRVVIPVTTMPVTGATFHAIQHYCQGGPYAKVGFRDMIQEYRTELETYYQGLQRELARLRVRREEMATESRRRLEAEDDARGRLRAANTRAFLKMVGKEAWPSAEMDEVLTAERLALPPVYQPDG